MSQYLLAVYGAPDARSEAFTQTLIDAGQYVYSCTVDLPDTAITSSSEGMLGDGPLHPESPQVSCLWIIEAATRTQAEAIAVRGSAACGQDLELRPVEPVSAAG